MDAIIIDIQQGRAKFVQRQSNRVTIFEVTHEGKTFTVCYDKIRKQIITFLPDPN